MDEAFLKSKRLKWSRSLRNEAYGKFLSVRDSLRALYDQIELKKAELIQARDAFGNANSNVKKQRSELRNTCIQHEIPDDYPVCHDANSSDYNHDTESITDIDMEEERAELDAMNVDKMKKVCYSVFTFCLD